MMKLRIFGAFAFALMLSMSIASGASVEKTNLAIKSLELSDYNPEIGDTVTVTFVIENKFGNEAVEASFGGGASLPSGGFGFGACCATIYTKSEIKKGVGEEFVYSFNVTITSAGEYKITASVKPKDKEDVNKRDNKREIIFFVE